MTATYTAAQLRALAQNSGFTGSGLDTITQIAQAESGGNPNAVNASDPGGSFGLTQINGASHPGAINALDPQNAFDQAFTISKGGTDFNPWSTFNNGQYAAFSTGGSGDPTGLSFTDQTGTTSTASSGGTAAEGNVFEGVPLGDGMGGYGGFGSSTGSGATTYAGGTWLSDLYNRIGGWFTRGFVVLLAIIMIGIGLYALNKDKINAVVAKMPKVIPA